MVGIRRFAGSLRVGAPLLIVVALRVGAKPTWPSLDDTWPRLVTTAGLALSVALVWLSGALVSRRPRWAAAALFAGAAALVVSIESAALQSPAAVLAIASATIVLLHLAAPIGARGRNTFERPEEAHVQSACATALAGGLAVLLLGRHQLLEMAAVAATLLLASWTLFAALVRGRMVLTHGWRRLLALTAAVSLAEIALAWGRWEYVLVGLALPPAAALVAIRSRYRSKILDALVDAVFSHQARTLVVTFVLLCAAGTVLLKLPASAAPGRFVSGIDALFTATSAVCVTGLIVLDTPNDFSALGQAGIALLIQLGGLGIMSFSTALFALLGRRFSLRHEGALADLVAHDRSEIYDAVRRMLAVTFGVELAGALLLWPMFVAAGDGAGEGLGRAVFTSISAFCNAGFALQSTSLIPYQTLPWIVHTVGALIILGGLSPLVVTELPRLLRRKPVSVHTRIVLWTSAGLLLGGAVIFGALEWSNTLGELSIMDRVHNAWFQSLTPRTAGFNSVDTAALRPATLWLTMALMFIGGSPGSTAGGIKTTTFALLLIAVRGAMRGRWEAVAFGRRFGDGSVYKAAALTTIAVVTVFVAMLAVQVTQAIPFEPALFEVVSALGTVGLSTGATAMLDDVGKLVIILAMFLGRVGPLTLFLFLRDRQGRAPWRLPASELDVG